MSDYRSRMIFRGIMSGPDYGLRKAWQMACASFWYTWRYPGPDDKPIGFWYSIGGAWGLFRGYLWQPRKPCS